MKLKIENHRANQQLAELKEEVSELERLLSSILNVSYSSSNLISSYQFSATLHKQYKNLKATFDKKENELTLLCSRKSRLERKLTEVVEVEQLKLLRKKEVFDDLV